MIFSFNVSLKNSRCMFNPLPSSSICNSFSMLCIPSAVFYWLSRLGVSFPQTSVLYITLNNSMVSYGNAGALGNAKYPFILSSLPGLLWLRVETLFSSMGYIELYCVLILKWIVWDRTVLTFKLLTDIKLNHLK